MKRYTALFGFCGIGGGALGFQAARAELAGVEGQIVSLGGIDNDPAACRDFERLTGSPALCVDAWRLTPAVLRAFVGSIAPDVVFGSPPCKGFSSLLSKKRAAEPKYQQLNRLVVQWTQLMLGTWVKPPRLILFENVPRITSRGKDLLAEVRGLLEAAGYALHEGTHDCGELGGLAQRRRRYLLVARHRETVPPLLHRPPLKRVRGVGEVLGELPMPEDPAGGAMHKLPRISWLNWVRLALIPAGGDWRDLPGTLDVDSDLAALLSGTLTSEALLERCLDEADDDRVDGWRDYVSSLAEAAGVAFPLYRIETRPADSADAHAWTTDGIGDPDIRYETADEAWDTITALQGYGGGWASAQFRVVDSLDQAETADEAAERAVADSYLDGAEVAS